MTRVVAGSCVCLVLRQLQLHLETITCWLLTSSWSSFSTNSIEHFGVNSHDFSLLLKTTNDQNLGETSRTL